MAHQTRGRIYLKIMNVIFIFNIRIQDYYKFNWPRYKNFKQKYPDDIISNFIRYLTLLDIENRHRLE